MTNILYGSLRKLIPVEAPWEWRGGGITKRHEETIGGDGYVHRLHCDDGFMGAKYVNI